MMIGLVSMIGLVAMFLRRGLTQPLEEIGVIVALGVIEIVENI